MPEEARNRRCKLLLVSLLLVTSYCLKFMVTNLLQRKLFIFLRIEAKLFTVELSSPALVSLFPVLYLPSIPGLPLLLLFVFISLSFILPKTPLTCHFFLKYRARLIFLSLCSSLNNAIQLFDIMLLYTICFWLSGGVVCKMLKQAIWKVLSERVVLDYGDKLLLPCLYLPTTSFHAGQILLNLSSFWISLLW
ncbi:uncharacterized protein [Gossypium hirsutum]|uniref:Uncharacterized protein isoform X2 n=1 Tax=Gossypium hirsutum TaxID=3635 RepID=A0ABM3AJW4_GOSHI|nr:uncharacterized protein LOC107911857 isoform X2 [Gossypium hirsutum]